MPDNPSSAKVHGASLALILLTSLSLAPELARAQWLGIPGPARCKVALAIARAKAAKLPERHISRFFAERLLIGAEMEAGNLEYDECVEGAKKAMLEISEHRHALAPGERLRMTTSQGVIELHGDVP